MKKPVWVLTGPTGAGKSALAYRLPASAPFEIIIADSRQVYKGLQIATTAPSVAELAKFPHHLCQILDWHQSFSAGSFVTLALQAIDDIHSRHKVPLILGGTFFYIKSLWEGLAQHQGVPEDIKKYCAQLSLEQIRNQLAEKDSSAVQKFHPNDRYRLQRALEIILSSGKSYLQQAQQHRKGHYDSYDFHSYWVNVERDVLYENINRRTKEMFEQEIIEEYILLRQDDKVAANLQCDIMRAIGYRQIHQAYLAETHRYSQNTRPYLQEILETGQPEFDAEHCRRFFRDQQNLQKAIDEVALASRHYAKRQLTWFRHEPRLKCIDHEALFLLLSKV